MTLRVLLVLLLLSGCGSGDTITPVDGGMRDGGVDAMVPTDAATADPNVPMDAATMVDAGGDGGTPVMEGPTGSPPVGSVHGFAQKGPFQAGGTVTIVALDEDGAATGDPVSAEIGAWGEFDFPEIAWVGPSLIEAQGHFFDENTGSFSNQPITLRSVVSVPEDDEPLRANVNLLTHVMTDYVLHWMAEGYDFDDLVRWCNEIFADELNLQVDVRQLNLFAVEAQEPLVTHVSGLLAYASIAATARGDVPGLIETFETLAWDFENDEMNEAFAVLWRELLEEAAQLVHEDALRG